MDFSTFARFRGFRYAFYAPNKVDSPAVLSDLSKNNNPFASSLHSLVTDDYLADLPKLWNVIGQKIVAKPQRRVISQTIPLVKQFHFRTCYGAKMCQDWH